MSSPIHTFERGVFAVRWGLALIFLGLTAGFGLYICHFLYEVYDLFANFHHNITAENVAMLAILNLVDTTMIAQLIVMTIQGGYAIFIHPFTFGQDRLPQWLKHGLGTSEQKIKMGMSIIGIMLVHLLRDFIMGGIHMDELEVRLWELGAVIVGTGAFCLFNLAMHHPVLATDHKDTQHP